MLKIKYKGLLMLLIALILVVSCSNDKDKVKEDNEGGHGPVENEQEAIRNDESHMDNDEAIEAGNPKNNDSEEDTNQTETGDDNGSHLDIESIKAIIDESLVEDSLVDQESIYWSKDQSFVIYIRENEYENEDDIEFNLPYSVYYWEVGSEEKLLEDSKGFISRIVFSPNEEFFYVSLGTGIINQVLVYQTANFSLVEEISDVIGSAYWRDDSRYLGFSQIELPYEDTDYYTINTQVYNIEEDSLYTVMKGEDGILAEFKSWSKDSLRVTIGYTSKSEEYDISFHDIDEGITNSVMNVNVQQAMTSKFSDSLYIKEQTSIVDYDHQAAIYIKYPEQVLYFWSKATGEVPLLDKEGRSLEIAFSDLMVSDDFSFLLVPSGYGNLSSMTVYDLSTVEIVGSIEGIIGEVYWLDNYMIFNGLNNNYINPELEVEYGSDVVLYEPETNIAYRVFESSMSESVLVTDVVNTNAQISITSQDEEALVTLFSIENLVSFIDPDKIYDFGTHIMFSENMYGVNEQYIEKELESGVVEHIWIPEIKIWDIEKMSAVNTEIEQFVEKSIQGIEGQIAESITGITANYDIFLINDEYVSLFYRFDTYEDTVKLSSTYHSFTISVVDSYSPDLYDFFTAEEHENALGYMITDLLEDIEFYNKEVFEPISDDTSYYFTKKGVRFYYPLDVYNIDGKLLEVEVPYEDIEGVIDIDNLPRF